MAHLARNVYIGKKVHFYLEHTVALAVFAPASVHVKGKSSALISSRFCFGERCEQVTDCRKHTRIRHGVRPRRPAYRALVYINNLVKILKSFYIVVFTLHRLDRSELLCRSRIEYLVDKARLSASADARHRSHYADRKGYVDIF